MREVSRTRRFWSSVHNAYEIRKRPKENYNEQHLGILIFGDVIDSVPFVLILVQGIEKNVDTRTIVLRTRHDNFSECSQRGLFR